MYYFLFLWYSEISIEFEVDIFLTGRKQIWKLNVKDRRKLQKLLFVIRHPLGTENSEILLKKNLFKISYLKLLRMCVGVVTQRLSTCGRISEISTHILSL